MSLDIIKQVTQGGTDHSPEYNEHFCYKLDFLAYHKAWLLFFVKSVRESKQEAQRL